MIVFLHPQYFHLPKPSGRDSNSDSCSWPEAKPSPLLCATSSKRGSARRPRQSSPLGSRVAVWFLLHAATRALGSTAPACPAVHGREEDAPAGGRCRAEQGPGQHTADAAGQRHLLLLHILVQAPALSAGYAIRRFPDPNREPAS